jgi:hypothetical protein
VVRHAHLCKLGDDGVAQIVEPEARKARGIHPVNPNVDTTYCP